MEMKLMPKDINKEKSINRAKNLTQLAICAVIIGFAGYNVYNAYSSMKTVPSSSYVKEPEATEPEETLTEPDPDKVVYSYADIPTKNSELVSGKIADTIGIRIPNVPQLVPVANDTRQATTNTIAGSAH